MGQSKHIDKPINVGARVRRTTAQTIPNSALTAVTFDAERYDTDNIHDNANNPERLTCRTAGVYLITASLGFDTNAAGSRMAEIHASNPNAFVATTRAPTSLAGAYMHLNLSTVLKLNAGDYVEVSVWQDSGGNLDLLAFPNCSEFAMQRIG